jgi:general nucleoside transport system permease protein
VTYELVRWIYRLKTVWAAILALICGAGLILLTGRDPVAAYRELFGGSFFEYWGFSATLVKLSPLLLAGLAVALPLRVGLFNVGAEGQIYIGGLFTTVFALHAPEMPAWIAIPLGAIAGMLGGGVWALIPALMKAYRDLNEVIVTLLMNYIAINLVSYIVSGPMRAPDAPYPYSPEVPERFWLPTLLPDTDAHAGVAVAIAAALLLYAMFRFTSIGFSMTTVGSNPHAARYAGMSVQRHILMAMLAGGALAGLAGCFEVLGFKHRLFHLFSAGYGYDGVVIAFLADANPLGSVVAATFLAGLESGANMMQRAIGVPVTVVDAIKGLVVMFVAASLPFTFQRSRWARVLQYRRIVNMALTGVRQER